MRSPFMKHAVGLQNAEQPHIARLANLVPLAPAEIDALVKAGRRAISFSARREIVHIGASLTGPGILTQGWAAHVRDFRDGRRQILHLLLPGDMISILQKPGAPASSTIIALTNASIAPAPSARNGESGLARAYALSADIECMCLQRQIARIGRLDAYERLADLFIEVAERLRHAGFAAPASFELPLTQEMLADSLGLTSVHVNRTLAQMRREGIIGDGRPINLTHADRLGPLVDHLPLIPSG